MNKSTKKLDAAEKTVLGVFVTAFALGLVALGFIGWVVYELVQWVVSK